VTPEIGPEIGSDLAPDLLADVAADVSPADGLDAISEGGPPDGTEPDTGAPDTGSDVAAPDAAPPDGGLDTPTDAGPDAPGDGGRDAGGGDLMETAPDLRARGGGCQCALVPADLAASLAPTVWLGAALALALRRGRRSPAHKKIGAPARRR
jgi:hypothetical protein